MPFVTAGIQPASIIDKSANYNTTPRHFRVLVVSPHLEVRRPVVRTLESLSVDALVCSTRREAEEVLSKQTVELVFCEERLQDGSYCDLIHSDHYDHRIPRVVVMTRTGEWELYFEAIASGAFDVIRSPWYATDVEMTVIRALREDDQPRVSCAVA